MWKKLADIRQAYMD